jgi:TonB family protein
MLLRPAESRGPEPAPVLASLMVHMTLLAVVAFNPPPVRKPESLYQREIAPHEKKLVWYRFNNKLPEVSPPNQPARPGPTRAEVKNPNQTIVAKSSLPDPAKQMTVAPGPELKIQQDLKAPNLMAFEPKAPAPPRQPKLFTPPPRPSLPTEQPALESGPSVAAAMDKAMDKRNPFAQIPAPRVPPRQFVPPPQLAKRTDEPQLQPGEARIVPAPLDQNPLAALPGPARPKPRAFIPPTQTAKRTDTPSTLPAGPAFASQAPNAALLAGIPQGTLPSRPQPKPFTPPTAGPPGRSSQSIAPALETAPEISSNVSAAVVGLNPVNAMPVVPEGSRRAQFSAAPEISRKGDGAGPAGSAAIVMPDLMIRGGGLNKREPIAALTRVEPTSRENLLAAARPIMAAPAPIIPPKSASAVHVSSGPDPRFEGRVVYTVAINMPNVTSYSGSWILWYAERERTSGEAPAVLPPNPLRKVDPVYDLSAVEDRVEGKVQLSGIIHKDGYVYGITILRGVDPRLDKNAIAALRKWEFEPARRDGNAVDVDVVIEIPFHLRPQK